MTTAIGVPILPCPTVRIPGAAADKLKPSEIDLSCTSHDDILCVHLRGEIDHFTAAPLRVALTAAAAYGYRHLDLDTRAVAFCDSALLGIIAAWCRQGRTLTHTASSRAVAQLLRIERALHCDELENPDTVGQGPCTAQEPGR
ncbi:STAS domain-containing protein [Streptomyces sp. NPDC058525]|uniref:STAS domain-containing protein n=1 Tax=Streptomyces sp. NPDC058525 TaxID=3346538 RepID=UPI00364AB77A